MDRLRSHGNITEQAATGVDKLLRTKLDVVSKRSAFFDASLRREQAY